MDCGSSIFIYSSAVLIAILLHLFQVGNGAAVLRKEMDDIPCLDVDAIDGDCSCDVTTPVASLGSDDKDCVLKEGNPKLNVSPELKSTHSEQQADLVKDNHEPRCTFTDMEPRDSSPEVPSPGKRQLNCALSNSPLIVLFKFFLNYILNTIYIFWPGLRLF